MPDVIASLLKTLTSFSKDFGVWMDWEKSDCASILIGTVVQYEEVSAVQVFVWFSLEEILIPECPFLQPYKQKMLLHRAPEILSRDSTSCMI